MKIDYTGVKRLIWVKTKIAGHSSVKCKKSLLPKCLARAIKYTIYR